MHRPSQVLAVLVECNRALSRASEEGDLFERVCKVLTGVGGYSAAWAGRVDHDPEHTIRPLAFASAPDVDFGLAQISWADSDLGRGPAGIAVRSRAPSVVREGEGERFQQWKARSLNSTARSAAAFPVFEGPNVVAVLGLNSSEPEAFKAEEIHALTRLSEDIGYALQTLRAQGAEDRRRQMIAESERRYRDLAALSADFYWELDPRGRLTKIQSNGADPAFERLVSKALGRRLWDLGTLTGGKARWAEFRQCLARRESFRDLLVRLRTGGASAQLAWVSLSGCPTYDSQGEYLGYHGVARDVTDRVRGETLQQLEHDIARAVAEEETVSAAVQRIIRLICTTLGWACGRYFRVDASGESMRLAEAWSNGTPDADEYVRSSKDLVFRKGQGLSGCAWQTREPVWSRDKIVDTRFSRPERQGDVVRMRAGFVFPVLAEGAVLGIISLSSAEVVDPDAKLLQAVKAIGIQVGQFLARKQAEEEMRRFRTAMDQSADLMLLIDRKTMQFVDVNSTASSLLGYSRAELLAMGPTDILPITRADLQKTYEALFSRAGGHQTLTVEYRCKDGSLLPVEITRHVIRSGDTDLIAIVARDVRERIRNQEALREQARRQQLLATFSQESLTTSDIRVVMRRGLDLVSEALRVDRCQLMRLDRGDLRLTCLAARGWPADWFGRTGIQLSTTAFVDRVIGAGKPLVIVDYDDETRATLPHLSAGVASTLITGVSGANGELGVLSAHCVQRRAFTDDDVSFLHSVANVLAVALERASAEERLLHMAQFDSLTGLPNRTLFLDRLNQSIAHAKRTGKSVAVMFLDLDRFKLVNDTLGHALGDKLLKEAASRLTQCVRMSDTVGRLGGDEFAATLLDLDGPGDAAVIAQKIIDAMAAPFLLDGQEAYVSASIGITLCPNDSQEATQLIMNADGAMYRAKEQGRNSYQYFTREMNDRTLHRLTLERQLRRAVEREEFVLHYQPRVSTRGNGLCGFEALLRWNHPERGLVGPGEFIPVLEETGLIVPVGEWILGRACQQVKDWERRGLRAVPVAVNFSARQFRQRNLDEAAKGVINFFGLRPSLLEFEITESLLMEDPQNAIRILQSLHAAGVKLSVDDFGTGYSSLSYLKRFPLDALKIDRSFIRDVTTDADDAAITLAVINMAHALGLKVVAEGVESHAQVGFLASHGCDEMQGFYFGKPAPAADCEKLLLVEAAKAA